MNVPLKTSSSSSPPPAKKSPSIKRRLWSIEKQTNVGAPTVWIVPDWSTYPVLENFYGHAKCARSSSFYEVMCSPMNATATTTLGESCASYNKDTDDDDEEHEGRQFLATGTSRRRRPFGGSFTYSCTTDTSEETGSLSLETESLLLYDRQATLPTRRNSNPHNLIPSNSGYAQWNQMRRTMSLNGGLVPVPRDVHVTSDRLLLQGNGDFSIDAIKPLDVDTNFDRPSSPLTSSRLRAKLQESLQETDDRMTDEYKRLDEAQRSTKQSRAQEPAAPVTVMWSLICGARTTKAVRADGLTFLTEKIGIAVSHRALNQLHRHRRHVCGILQIVTAHNPDLELTERQLDSFEAPDAMLANDIKYVVLHQQYKLLLTSVTQRRCALVEAKLHNGSDCFEKPQVKCVMMSKLLRAVSWYRLVQRNAREKSASSSVGVVSALGSVVDTPPSSSGSDDGQQKLQVEKILDVLADEDFYSVFSESMCQPNWWEIAQAHFENLIFSSKNSRICQWMLQLSKDAAAVSYEKLETDKSGGSRRTLAGDNVHCNHHILHQASWTRDPPPEQILDFLDRLAGRVRREFDVPAEVSKSLNVFIQRTVFSRIAVLCFNQRATRDCQRKDKLWRKKCVELSGLPMENFGVSPDLVAKIHSSLPSHRVHGPSGSNSPCQRRVFLVRAIEAFNGMASVVPCDLLDELMHGVVILHHEAALVLGTTHFSVETFFPLLAYVLVHCRLPTIHAQLHLLEKFAITAHNANGEESYYVYCVHAAVEYICNTAGLGIGVNSAGTCATSTNSSAVSTPDGASVTPAMPMNTLSPPTTFSLDRKLKNRLGVEGGSISKSRVKQSEAA
ncbi:unnamed protein product [Peronospora effusa]|uniref:VPS9 domain-containing protein n=1 Tax=Peronospora effusa TaxID=542832 RepID=A0A3M6VPJ4_9STRA|nr:hypothetical protein DD238_003096 [Peronospora effusa]RQM15551.1 hypothetical protein DD237_003860 [Peronospora effusa]CAI5715403.1 unnamed protein product [Peronospora effusa]